jgi:hypothetical protein
MPYSRALQEECVLVEKRRKEEQHMLKQPPQPLQKLTNPNPSPAISPLFAAESEIVPFEAPDFGEADGHETGATALQGLYPSVTETELVPLGISEVGAADELAIGESNDESNMTSLVEAQSAVNEPEEHTSDSKVHSRLRATLMDLRKRFIVTNSDVDQLAAADSGGGLDLAIAQPHGDDTDGTIDYLNDEEMFEMLLAG